MGAEDGFALGEVTEALDVVGFRFDEFCEDEVGEGEDGGGGFGSLGKVEVALDEEDDFLFIGGIFFNLGGESFGSETVVVGRFLALVVLNFSDFTMEAGEGFGHGEVIEVSAFEFFDEGGDFFAEGKSGCGLIEFKEALFLDVENVHHLIKPGRVAGLESEKALVDFEGAAGGSQGFGGLFTMVVDGGIVVPGVGEVEEPPGVVWVPGDQALPKGEGFVEEGFGFVDLFLFFEHHAEVVEKGGEFLFPVAVVGFEGDELAGAFEGGAKRGIGELVVAHFCREDAGATVGDGEDFSDAGVSGSAVEEVGGVTGGLGEALNSDLIISVEAFDITESAFGFGEEGGSSFMLDYGTENFAGFVRLSVGVEDVSHTEAGFGEVSFTTGI